MDYAKRILGKFGWKEGEGLGKNSDGISKPLRANLKFDNAGLGADESILTTNRWWERVFNEAARNVEVKRDEDGALSIMNLKNEDDTVEITTKDYSLRKLRKAKQKQESEANGKYDNFLKSSLLTKSGDEVEDAHRVEYTDIAVNKFKPLTDEELFRACGGRTAHKGARHGLKLNGKLSRLEKQEKELLAKMQEKKQHQIVPAPEESETTPQKKKRKHKIEQQAEPAQQDEVEQEDTGIKLKKSKKHKRKRTQVENEFHTVDNDTAAMQPINAKKRDAKDTTVQYVQYSKKSKI